MDNAAGRMRVALAQLQVPIGDIGGNAHRIAEEMDWAEEIGADVLVLPELALTGYPPEDLLHLSGFVEHNLDALTDLAGHARDCVTIVGFVDPVPARADTDATPRTFANAVALLWQGQVRDRYHKVLLPNYGVFDERRYFAPGTRRGGTWRVRHAEVGVLVCEDVWRPELADAQAADGAQALFVANASPFHRGKVAEREHIVTDTAARCGVPVAYCNLVGGHDEVVFDGGSLVTDARGAVLARGAAFTQDRLALDLDLAHHAPASRRSTFVCRPAPRAVRPALEAPTARAPLADLEEVYTALVRSLADYCANHGHTTAVVGLSGGIDSGLVATLAADALGPDRVWGITLPGPASPPAATDDAAELAKRLGIRHDVVDVSAAHEPQVAALAELAGGDPSDDDVLARARGTFLLGVAARSDGVVLPTGNKTETALGYGTLGGDAAGGFAVLRDVPKTLVYALCDWRSALPVDVAHQRGWVAGPEVVPAAIRDKPPSAERAPDRPDREVPASYATVDAILERFLERAESPSEIAARGFDAAVVARIVDLVERNEASRRQMPPGVKVTSRAFGRDRRMPLGHDWRAVDDTARTRRFAPSDDDWLEG